MSTRRIEDAKVCPYFHRAVELIGRRWSGAIVQSLLTNGSCRFVELKRRVPDLSDRLLSERLKELEEAEIVEREVKGGPPVEVRYRLTPRGKALEPALEAIGAWATRWLR